MSDKTKSTDEQLAESIALRKAGSVELNGDVSEWIVCDTDVSTERRMAEARERVGADFVEEYGDPDPENVITSDSGFYNGPKVAALIAHAVNNAHKYAREIRGARAEIARLKEALTMCRESLVDDPCGLRSDTSAREAIKAADEALGES